jgi:hypothetical protein
MTQLIGLSGSLRGGSYNTALLRVCCSKSELSVAGVITTWGGLKVTPGKTTSHRIIRRQQH